jgi:Cu(I)/Ag(I) efflux system membrane protein CusA/SilA
MIDAVIEFSIRRRWLVIFAGLALAAWGWWAAVRTPIDAIPDLSENQVIVFTDWPGRSPAEIERQVTYPLSLQLQGLDDVRVIRTSSDFGFSMIHVIFEDRADLLAARRQIGERLAAASAKLPPGVQPFLAPESPATGQIFWYTVEGAGRDLGELRTIHDTLVKQQLAATTGVAEVASVGGYTTELQVLVDPLRLEASGVTLGQLSQEISAANVALAGHAVQSPTAEYLVEASAILGQAADPGESRSFDYQQAVHDLENVVIPLPSGGAARLGELAEISLAPGFRRGVLEKDGSEVVGGVVMMRYGANPLEVTQRLYQKITQLQRGLPSGVYIVPGYDRTPLIRGAVGTVSGTVVEAMIVAAICVLLVLLHLRTSLVVVITLPLAVLGAFALMWLLRTLGVADVQTNIMSLAGLAISIGVLVDSSIVIAENVMHNLHQQFGDAPVRGDTRAIVAASCRTVGRPIFFSVLILLLSFLPVFGLGGIEGKMFFPLACTKSFAVAIAAVLSITLAPALCTVLIRGRLRNERDSWIVRSFMDVYRPLLNWLIDRPAAAIFLLGATLLVGFAASPWRPILPLAACVSLLAVYATARGKTFWLFGGGLLAIAFTADQAIEPPQSEFLTPLDEGVVMDMPITIPRASVSQSADDLKARDMMLCRFPEVEMAMGKAGRAETAADPAPIDMIETMVSFRPREFWPKRSLHPVDAHRLAEHVWGSMVERKLIAPASDDVKRQLLADSLTDILPRFDALLREYAYQRNREFARALAPALLTRAVEESAAILQERSADLPEASDAEVAALVARLPQDVGRRLAEAQTEAAAAAIFDAVARETERIQGEYDLGGASWREKAGNLLRGLAGQSPVSASGRVFEAVQHESRRAWKEYIAQLNDELIRRAAETFARLALEDLLLRGEAQDPHLADAIRGLQRFRESPPRSRRPTHHGGAAAELPDLEPTPAITILQAELTERLSRRVMLWRKERSELVGFGGEMDLAVQMPGWTNVWTMPIQNRVDMLSTGVNTTLGIRVLGNNHARVVSASEEIARAVSEIPGASQVVADPVRGKGYLSIDFDRDYAAQLGVRLADAGMVVQAALGGLPAATIPAGREQTVVRIRFPAHYRDDLEMLRRLPVPAIGQSNSSTRHVMLEELARAEITDGPASIKGDNGLLRNYVRLNVMDRNAREFIEEAQQRIAQLPLPEGVHWEWTGQFQHQERARRTLIPVVLLVGALILGLLYATYRDMADALLVLSVVPGAVAGGMLMQWCFGFKFSVTVAVGYIACFGMAASTGVIMLVYLREALAKAGGLERVTLPQLRQAVLTGAVHRLRPKLLTEATTILGLAPMLWADGVGAEVIRPMVAPVLGGILVADEVIDLFLPVMFYWVRERRWRKLHGEPAAASDSPAGAQAAATPEFAST